MVTIPAWASGKPFETVGRRLQGEAEVEVVEKTKKTKIKARFRAREG